MERRNLERTKFDRDTLNQENHYDVTDPTSTERPVSGHESTKRCVLTPRHVENDQTGTGTPVLVDQKKERKIDFRVPGLSHSVAKESEHLQVQELVKRIETHPHREALHADLQQNYVYNPFSKDSKEMIRELSNVEFFELCETTPKVQYSHCLFHWNQGIVRRQKDKTRDEREDERRETGEDERRETGEDERRETGEDERRERRGKTREKTR